MNPTEKEIKIDLESDANSNASSFYFTLKVKLGAACQKCHNSWWSNSLTFIHSLFKFHVGSETI